MYILKNKPMKFFDRLAGKKEKEKETISVEMLDKSGAFIQSYEMLPEELPTKFDFTTRIILEDSKWVVHEAIPNNAEEFLKTKKLTLRMSKFEWFDNSIKIHMFPSACTQIAESSDVKIYPKDLYFVDKSDYRQSDFFRSSAVPDIKKDLEGLEKIKETCVRKIVGVITYTDCYKRERTGEPNLQIDFDELKDIISIMEIGNLKYQAFNGSDESYVKNGIAFRTENTLYYGILNNENMITTLCMGEFSDNTVIEINQILKAFNLVFIEWFCKVLILPK